MGNKKKDQPGKREDIKQKTNGDWTNLHDFENESRVLEIVFEAEVDLANVLRRLRIVDVHVHQGYGTILPKGHLHVPGAPKWIPVTMEHATDMK